FIRSEAWCRMEEASCSRQSRIDYWLISKTLNISLSGGPDSPVSLSGGPVLPESPIAGPVLPEIPERHEPPPHSDLDDFVVSPPPGFEDSNCDNCEYVC
ncbi:Large tegument protein deneddylase, partial [Clarias magur]